MAGEPAPARRAWQTRTTVVLMTAAMAAIGVALAVGPVSSLPPPPGAGGVPLWSIAVAFVVLERLVVHIRFGRESQSVDLTELGLVVGLFLLAPGDLVAAGFISSVGVRLLQQRTSLLKACFNVSHRLVNVCVIVLLFGATSATRDVLDPAAWLAAVTAVLAAGLLISLVISLAISAASGEIDPRAAVEVVVCNLAASAATSSLAIVAVIGLSTSLWAVTLFGVVAVVLYLANRAYVALREQHAVLEHLYDFTRQVGPSDPSQVVMAKLLGKATELLRVDRAELCLIGGGSSRSLRASLGEGGELEIATMTPEELASELRGWALDRQRTAGPESGARHRPSWLPGDDGPDVLFAALRGEDGVIGTMLVGSRQGSISKRFDRRDRRVFETLVAHGSVALDNGRLVERLHREVRDKEHQAQHDALTGLPNRTLFGRRVDDVLRARRDHEVAVLLIDLDRFKEVNDTLGHHNGDLLLQEVAVRLLGTLDASSTVARLGGDEFAVLLPSVTSRAAARSAAVALQQALEQPFSIGELLLDVGASVGIAICPEDGDEAATLLQRADVAMYAAKASNRGTVECYDPHSDQYSPDRLALVGELRHAIGNDELVVYYQPKADMRTGAVIGVEALVRWHHPSRGLVPPDVFIPMAEHVGLIRPITELVLETALRQCRVWQLRGIELDVAVNLSARSLLDDDLARDVMARIEAAGLAPRSLCLELTESSVMADPARNSQVLGELSAMGVDVAIDDFGTGYSSLSYLKRLPVDEIKIDRSFVMNMANDADDAVIVRSIIDLGRNLGRRVVAEGVEDAATWRRLADLGCDVAQGYFLSRPVPAVELVTWLKGWTPPAVVMPFPAPTVSPSS